MMANQLRFSVVPLLALLTAVGCTNRVDSADGGGQGGTGDSTGGDNTGGAGASAMFDAIPACAPDNAPEPPHSDIPNGVYSVPVPPDLEAYASYPVDDITLCWVGSALRLGYSLPAELVGKKERVSFDGPFDENTGTFVMTSNDGTATCAPGETTWRCDEVFTGVVVDLEEVAKELEGVGADEAAARLKVSELFGSDPIGVLHFPSPI